MEISKSTVIFFSIILMTGALTVVADLKSKKIYNNHLAISTGLGLAALIYTSVWAQEDFLFHIINGLIALVVGFYFYRSALWRGGDAKLFTLYAFLMPVGERDHILFSSAINLFACSFITGTMMLIPLLIKDIVGNGDAVIDHLFPREKRKNLLGSMRITIFFSWILFPVYYFAKIIHIPIISLAVTYLIFHLTHHFLREKFQPKLFVIGSYIIFGLFMRLWLDPETLDWPTLTYSIFRIGFLSALSACIYASLDLLKENRDRVPFAPLLFIGCILSYTPFLTWVTHFVRR